MQAGSLGLPDVGYCAATDISFLELSHLDTFVDQISCHCILPYVHYVCILELACVLAQPDDGGVSSHVLRNQTAAVINDTMYSYGSVVELQCAEGYYVEGVQSIACVGDNEWNDMLGECERKMSPIAKLE